MVASVVGGDAGPQAESPVTPEPSVAEQPPGYPRPESAETVTRSGDPSPTARPGALRAPTSSQPVAPSPSSEVSPSAREPDDRLPSPTLRSATFECSLDGAAYASCASTHSYTDLHPGWHTFAVRATDPAGNVDGSPASTRWLSTNADPATPRDG